MGNGLPGNGLVGSRLTGNGLTGNGLGARYGAVGVGGMDSAEGEAVGSADC